MIPENTENQLDEQVNASEEVVAEGQDGQEVVAQDAAVEQDVAEQSPEDQEAQLAAARRRWYVVQVYTGYEDRVQADLEKSIEEAGVEELFGQVLVPRGDMISMFTGEEPAKEKIFPGYLLINMEMVGEAHRLVVNLARVSRFLGGESPMALSDKEVERIFTQIEGGLSVSADKSTFTVGGEVHITSGPFSGFFGVIDKVDDEHERVSVMVSIFGRMTPVELGFDQVKV